MNPFSLSIIPFCVEGYPASICTCLDSMMTYQFGHNFKRVREQGLILDIALMNRVITDEPAIFPFARNRPDPFQ